MKGAEIDMTNISVRIDEDLKNDFSKTCHDLGMDMSTAITIFARKVAREKRIPFDVSIDPFFSESNLEHLYRGIDALNSGKGKEHDIIEVE